MKVNQKYTNKGEIQRHLSKTKFLAPDSPGFFHGRLYRTLPSAPKVVWQSQDRPRDDQETEPWLTATEFQDSPSTLQDKVDRLAALVSLSKVRKKEEEEMKSVYNCRTQLSTLERVFPPQPE